MIASMHCGMTYDFVVRESLATPINLAGSIGSRSGVIVNVQKQPRNIRNWLGLSLVLEHS
jgi:hypothetical protein